MSSDIEFKDMGLKNLVKIMKGKIPKAKVGILGKEKRSEDVQTNAEIGAKHEFGTDELPVRSFLRMPIADKMDSYLTQAGAISKETFEEAVKTGDMTDFMLKVGVVGEQVVLDAFDSRGFGKWKESNMKYKKTKQTLVETQQLRNSITSGVEE